MKIKEIMTTEYEHVQPDAMLDQIAGKMKRSSIGFIPVTDDGAVIGLLTDRDIVTRVVADGMDPKTTEVRQVMTPKVWTIHEDQDAHDAASMMREKKVRRLIVVDRNEKPVGVITLGDLAVHGPQDIAQETLRAVSHPAKPARGHEHEPAHSRR